MTQGIINKYIITKVNGEPVDPRAEYFVLRLDQHQNDKLHQKACVDAVLTYADKIKDHLPELAEELYDKYWRLA